MIITIWFQLVLDELGPGYDIKWLEEYGPTGRYYDGGHIMHKGKNISSFTIMGDWVCFAQSCFGRKYRKDIYCCLADPNGSESAIQSCRADKHALEAQMDKIFKLGHTP